MGELIGLNQLNKVFLVFEDRKTEEKYLLNTIRLRIKYFNTLCIVVLIVHIIYFTKNFLGTPSEIEYIRLFICIPSFALALILRRDYLAKISNNSFVMVTHYLLFMSVFTQIFFHIESPYTSTQISHMIPVIFYSMFIFLGIKYSHLVFYVGPIILIITIVTVWVFLQYDFGQKIDAVIIILINYTLAIIAKYNMELFHRKVFSKDEEQNRQKEIIKGHTQSLHIQKELYSGLANRSGDMIIIKDLDGHLSFVSKGSENLLGYKPEELIGTEVGEMIHEEDLKYIQNTKDTGNNSFTQLDYRMIHKSNEIVWVQSSSSPIFDKDHKLISVQCSIRNISKKKEYEINLKNSKDKLEELNAQKDRFFSIISHDLKSPVNNVVALVSLLNLSLDKESNQETSVLLDALDKAALSSKGLLENLLTWARTQLNEVVVARRMINIKKMVDENITLADLTASQKSITINSDISNTISVFVDEEMLKTVIRNILSNAIKFSFTNSEIQIYLANDSINEIDLVIQDHGVGISKERINGLFDISKKTSTKGTTEEVGTGLGLIICEEFMELNQGKIRVESEENIGTKFIMTMPKKD